MSGIFFWLIPTGETVGRHFAGFIDSIEYFIKPICQSNVDLDWDSTVDTTGKEQKIFSTPINRDLIHSLVRESRNSKNVFHCFIEGSGKRQFHWPIISLSFSVGKKIDSTLSREKQINDLIEFFFEKFFNGEFVDWSCVFFLLFLTRRFFFFW